MTWKFKKIYSKNLKKSIKFQKYKNYHMNQRYINNKSYN